MVLAETLTDEYVKIKTDGSLILGQEQDSALGGFREDKSFSGKIAQFLIYDRTLTADEIMSLSTCGIAPGRSIIAWEIDNWIGNNVQVRKIKLSSRELDASIDNNIIRPSFRMNLTDRCKL